ncbi:helicase HerA domain-containing protein [Bradyrhizobium sp.]|uniref:helicase HerA domain-containing protein n=1 Tax=Bradyrhizobium sp. TaxID=376 RepID=UPI0039E475A8
MASPRRYRPFPYQRSGARICGASSQGARMSARSPIPKSALEHHIAVLGKTGSGKTATSKSAIVEPELTAGGRVAVIDPTGAWWGLRLAQDGKTPGFPIYVFGGDHGDFPLAATQGEMMAEAIGSTNTPVILDTKLLKTSERMRFFTDFADAILRTNKGPLRLVIDEAHLFAPQAGTRGAGAMPDMLHAANNLISLGRSCGLRIVLISQRPAKLHKDSLTQVETLLAMRLIAPQDRKAIEEWIADQADKETGKDIIASLPSLKAGEAWCWSPEAHFLKRVQFPMPASYDSSKPQAAGRTTKRLSPIDVEKLQAQFAKVKTEAAAKDPKVLQKRIAELEQQLRRAQGSGDMAPAVTQLADERRIGREEGEAAGFRRGLDWCSASYGVFGKHLGAIGIALERAIADTKGQREIVEKELQKSGQQTGKQTPVDAPKREPGASPVPRQPKPAPAGGDGNLSPAKQKVLDAIAWAASLGKPSIAKDMVAILAGASPTSSSYANNLGALRSAGLIDYPAPGEVGLTAKGDAVAVPPADAPTHDAIMQKIGAVLPPAQMRILAATAEHYPNHLGKDELAACVGASPTSSSFANNLGRLRTLGFITYPAAGSVRAGESLFP